MRNFRKAYFVVGAAAVAAAVWAVQDAPILMVEGKTVSSNLRQADGTLMVPVKDLATAFGYEVKESTGRIELVRTAGTAGFSTSGMAALPFSDFAPKPKATFSAQTGEEVAYGGFSHRLIGITYPGREYRQEFDSRRQRFKAPYGEEQLVVLRMSVTNQSGKAAYAQTPSTFGVSVFDESKVGYPVTAIDARQATGVQTNDSYLAPMASTMGSVLLAPGGSVEYALIASMPKTSKASQVVLNLPASSSDPTTSGAIVTLDTVEP
jgi:hypothetical protein